MPTRQKPQVLHMPDKDLWDLLPCLGLELFFSSHILCSGNHKPAVGFRIHHADSFYSFSPRRLNSPCLLPFLAFLLRHASTEAGMCSCACLRHGYLHQCKIVRTFKPLYYNPPAYNRYLLNGYRCELHSVLLCFLIQGKIIISMKVKEN